MIRISLLFALLFLILGCREDHSKSYTLPAFSEHGVHAVVEIPAGTNHKYEFDPADQAFELDSLNGSARIIDFLPYPGNYGFIPSTRMDESRGGDGDALDILVLAAHQPRGTVLDVKPIAALLLVDRGELDTKLIAVPLDSSLVTLKADNFQEFSIEYNAAQKMIEDWFLHYKGYGEVRSLGWRDEHFARAEIEKWALSEKDK